MAKTVNVLDNLFSDDDGDVTFSNESLLSDEIVIPFRCSKCKTAIVCSVLPTFISLSKIKVLASIEQCPYSQPLKNAESRKTTI